MSGRPGGDTWTAPVQPSGGQLGAELLPLGGGPLGVLMDGLQDLGVAADPGGQGLARPLLERLALDDHLRSRQE